MFSGGSLVLIFLKHHMMCYQPRPGSPECQHRCCHSLCAGPGAHIGSAVQPELCSGWDPPAPPGSTRPGWTWKTPDIRVSGQLSRLCWAGGDKQQGSWQENQFSKLQKVPESLALSSGVLWQCFQCFQCFQYLGSTWTSWPGLALAALSGRAERLRWASRSPGRCWCGEAARQSRRSTRPDAPGPEEMKKSRGWSSSSRRVGREGGNVVMLPLHTSCCGLLQKGVSDGRKNNLICFARYVKVSLLAIIRKCIAAILEEKKTGLSFTS